MGVEDIRDKADTMVEAARVDKVPEAAVLVAATVADRIREPQGGEERSHFVGETPPGGGGKQILPRATKDNHKPSPIYKCWLRPKNSPDLQGGLGEGVVWAGTAPIPGHPALCAGLGLTSAGFGLRTHSVTIPNQPVFQAAGLKDHVSAWQQVTKNHFVLQDIVGVQIPLHSTPPLRLATKEELGRRETDPVIDEAIGELLKLGAIQTVSEDTEVFLSRVFTVPKTERGKEYGRRFILNLKVSSPHTI